MSFEKALYFFRSEEGLCPDIPITRRKELMLGRSPLTGIKDSKLSRHQLKVLWNDSGIFATQCGDNSSYINNRPLEKGESVELQDGDRLHLISNRFPFRFFLKTGMIGGKNEEEKEKSADKQLKRTAEGEIKVGQSSSSPSSSQIAKDKATLKSNHWSLGLLASMNDPELKVAEKENVVIIKDKYPKATHHYLILPKSRIANLESLKPDHIPLLEEMSKEGRLLADSHPKFDFRLGYHAIPSMSQIHLHVISQDFNSPCLKTKKHWNSFVTPYFVNPGEVLDKLRSKGKYSAPPSDVAKRWLNSDLKCHKCEAEQKTMPALKTHLLTHL